MDRPEANESSDSSDDYGAPVDIAKGTLPSGLAPNQTSNQSFDTSKPADQTRHIDVNSFADLLMKGVASPAQAPTLDKKAYPIPSFGISDVSSQQSGLQSESSSRQESNQTGDMKTPVQLNINPRLGDTSSLEKVKVAPPAPKSRHGKTLATPVRAPQVVSFDTFDATADSKQQNYATENQSNSATESLRSNSVASRTNSYSSASLPPLSLPEENRHRRMSSESRTSIALMPLTPTESKKSAPPPVPIARRTTVSHRNRSDTVSSNTSQPDHSSHSRAPSVSENIDSTSKAAPPPPPTRRSGSSNSIPHATGLPSTTNQEQHSVNAHLTHSRLRSASGSSFSSIAPAPAPAPPPPPTRRRSSRHSKDPSRQNSAATGSGPPSRRTSTDLPRSSMDSQRWLPSELSTHDAAIEEEQRFEGPTSNPSSYRTSSQPQVDILADMDAFQKEIDALRARALR